MQDKISGLTTEEVNERIKENKVNIVTSTQSKTYGDIVKENVFTFFNAINIILFIAILLVNSPKNGLFIGIIVCNSVIGIYQECKAKKNLDKLRILVVNKCDVIRDNKTATINVNEIVLNDIVLLKEGMQIPTDGKMVDGYIETDESLLTGESKQKEKHINDDVYSGSFVVAGEGYYEVLKVGDDSYANKLALEAKQYKKQKSELKDSINKILKVISYLIFPLGALIFYSQIKLPNATVKSAVVSSVAGIIGMIPEGLFFLTSIALAISMVNLAKKRTLVQQMYCIETLARVDVLCLDKTGTITKGQMTVQKVETLEDIDINEVMGAINKAFPKGNNTQKALDDYFKVNENAQIKNILPFSSSRKYSALTLSDNTTYYYGAVQFLMPNNVELCKKVDDYDSEGYRVLCVFRSNKEIIEDKVPDDLIPLAIIGIADVIKDSAYDTIKYFTDQGVTLKIISGDDPRTVSSIAKKVNIPNAEKLVDATTLKTSDDINKAIGDNFVFGRVTPEQKKEMVLALQSKGYTVAMTGDGVNDVPSLKASDMSIAMASGSDAAKNTANIVLLDSDFASLPSVLNEGRRVINNINRASSMFLIKTTFSVILAVLIMILGVKYPFVPIQMTLINAFATGIPTFFLQLEPSYDHVKKGFVKKAFSKALPSGIAISLLVFLVTVVIDNGLIRSEMYNTVCTLLTAFAYSFSLYFVYKPLTKYRFTVIMIDIAAFVVSMYLLRSYMNFMMPLNNEIIVILFMVILTPLLIFALSKIVDKIFEKIK